MYTRLVRVKMTTNDAFSPNDKIFGYFLNIIDSQEYAIIIAAINAIIKIKKFRNWRWHCTFLVLIMTLVFPTRIPWNSSFNLVKFFEILLIPMTPFLKENMYKRLQKWLIGAIAVNTPTSKNDNPIPPQTFSRECIGFNSFVHL